MKKKINKPLLHENRMKRIGVAFGILVFLVLINFSFVLAVDCTSFNYSEWSACTNGTQTRTIVNSSPANCTGGSPVLSQTCGAPPSVENLSDIEQAYTCLETKVKNDCSGAQGVQEIALTILSSPKRDVSEGCYNKLKTYDQGNCFGQGSCNIRDTALAVLAYSHLNQQTTKYTDWLLNQTMTSTEVVWFVQQDSNEPSNCKISYDSVDYPFSVQGNKKLNTNAGPCLSLSNSDYWFLVDPSCYEKNFSMTCDQSFIGNLLYKQPTSSTIYVLSNTQSAAASGTINLKVKSKCFGRGSCDYEASAWSALALQKEGINVDEFLPYLVSSLENNKQYLPYAFLNMLEDYSDYGTKLIQQQELNSWQAENTAYDQFYDTALALLSLYGSTQTQVTNAKNWLLKDVQGNDGCWNNANVRDTAIILWALQQKQSSFIPGNIVGSPASCVSSGFYCTPRSDCDTNQILPNYAGCGSSGSQVCCQTNNLKTCSENLGEVCSAGQVCSGATKLSSDTTQCCLVGCIDEEPELTQCELGGGICKDSCSASQTETSASCGVSSSQVCCERETTPEKTGSLWWLWLLLIILIILVVVAIIFRDKIKIWIYKRKSGFKKDEGTQSRTGPTGPMPPSGMLPPQQRPPMRSSPMPGQAPMGMQRRPLPQQPLPGRGLPPRV